MPEWVSIQSTLYWVSIGPTIAYRTDSKIVHLCLHAELGNDFFQGGDGPVGRFDLQP